MEVIDCDGISCQVVRRGNRTVRIVFRGGHLRIVLPWRVDPLPIIERHKKWIAARHEKLRQQRELAAQMDLVHRSSDEFITLVRGLSERYADVLGVQPTGIGFREMKSKWGSCSAKGKISLNTRLQALPDELVAFIVFHELAHLKIRNHGAAFKALIQGQFPHGRNLDRQLKLFSLKIL